LVVLERNGLPSISPETYHACTRYPTPDRLARHAGSFEPGTVEFDRLGRRLAREFDDLYVGLVNTQTAGFFPGISGVLERILEQNQRREDDTQRGTIQLGALTNACVAYAHAVLNVNTLEVSSSSPTTPASSHFASIHGADTVPAPKPEPDGLWLVCRELGVAPERAVYVGDSPSDAMAAHGAGMASIGVLWGSHSKEGLRRAPFTRLCSSVDELCELLRL
jgi:phosphoglycolate phosphatase-like HAD superfamily hydrolase